MAVSLVMLSLGSIPQTFAGTTVIESGSLGALLTVGPTCGLGVGAAVNIGNIAVGQVKSATTTVDNTGTVDATLEANAGVPSASGPSGGGFAAASDGITHINPISMRISVTGALQALDNSGNDVFIPGGLPVTGSPHTLTLEVTANIVNAPVVDPALAATIPLTATC